MGLGASQACTVPCQIGEKQKRTEKKRGPWFQFFWIWCQSIVPLRCISSMLVTFNWGVLLKPRLRNIKSSQPGSSFRLFGWVSFPSCARPLLGFKALRPRFIAQEKSGSFSCNQCPASRALLDLLYCIICIYFVLSIGGPYVNQRQSMNSSPQ